MDKRFGRYMACTKCDCAITNEKNGFTNGFGKPLCQSCGLQELLTPLEWYTIFAVQNGSNIIDLRKKCSTLRPLSGNAERSVVEFKSPDGCEYCIVNNNLG